MEINFNDVFRMSNEMNEVFSYCSEHFACEGCEMLEKEMHFKDSVVICENIKRENKENGN